MKRCLVVWLFFYSSITASAAYDRAFVAQCLEEQSYSPLLTYIGALSPVEYDQYLLNAAGYAAYQSGLQEQSFHYYNRSLEKDSNNIQANLYQGLICKQQLKFDAAISFFKRLIALKSPQAKYYKYIADCYSGLKNDDSSLFYLTKAYGFSPSDLNMAGNYASLLYSKKKYEAAAVVTDAGLKIDSNNVTLLSIAIRSLYLQKKFSAVLSLANRLLNPGLGDAVSTPLLFGALASLQLKDYEQCIVYSNYLMTIGNESEQVYYYTAKAYSGLKQYEKSNEFLRKCLDLAISANIESYYIEMAENLEQLKNYGKAQKNYDTARFLFGNNMILYRKALAYDAVDQKDRARKAYLDFLKAVKKEDTAIVNFARKRAKAL